MQNINQIISTHDIVFITLDTLRYDIATELLAQNRTPNLAKVLPNGWEKRHSPGNFTYASHQAFFAGFLPTPVTPGIHPRLFALKFSGSTTTTEKTCVLEGENIVKGLARKGYHTVCIGGVGFFNKQNPLSNVIPSMFAESYWNRVTHNQDFVTQYVNTLQKQAKHVKAALGKSSFARLAIGGGTPTQLPIHHLETVLNVAEDTMGADLQQIPISVEMSPETATKDKLELLRSRNVSRASIGVQSFFESEVAAVNRRQTTAEVEAALTRMREAGFPTINIDLIYGLPGQTVETWLQSIRAALQFEPEEIFLYPLYVRPLTGLGTSEKEWDDIRLNCYRQGRDFLLSQGYSQTSMRMFQRNNVETRYIASLQFAAPIYCCQQDGMVGIGCGARSYTDDLHYSNEYA
ncbi:MAG: radical SAM protein, partial [Rivularia sp. (in: cyanobacteria)]